MFSSVLDCSTDSAENKENYRCVATVENNPAVFCLHFSKMNEMNLQQFKHEEKRNKMKFKKKMNKQY